MASRDESQEKKLLNLDKHVEHLRAGHFSLLALCFGLISAWALSRETEVKRAVNQLREINNVVQNWNPNWVDPYVNSLMTQARPLMIERPFENCSIPADGDSSPIQFELKGPNWTVQPLPQALKGLVKESHKLYLPATPSFNQPQSLAEFEKLWDALQISIPIYVATNPPEKAIVTDKYLNQEGTRKTVDIRCGDLIKDARKVQLELRSPSGEELTSLSEFVRREVTHAYFDFYSARITIPVQTTKLQQFEGQTSLKRTHGANWDLGPFARTFTELNKITQNYRDLSFNQLFAVLEAEASRSEERLEIFGAKIPTPEISRWGSLAMLLVQLYLLLHLQTFSLLVHADAVTIDAPWIGIYPSKWAKVSTTISAFLLPTIVLTILCVYQVMENGNRWIWGYVIAAITLSTLFSSVSFITVRRIWKEFGRVNTPKPNNSFNPTAR